MTIINQIHVQKLFKRKYIIPKRKNGTLKTVSQSRFPSAQLTYSLLATKHIHVTNTKKLHKY